MTPGRRTDSASALDLHPHRLVLLLVAVLSTVSVQILIAVAAQVNGLEILLYAVAIVLVFLDATGVGAHFLTITTALGWVWAGTRGVDGYTLVVAIALLMTHAVLALIAHGHPGAPLERAVALRWVTRTVTVAALTAVTWLLALVSTTQRPPAAGTLSAAALVAVAVVLLWLRAELLRGRAGS